METKTMPKNAAFCCNLCDFKCFKKSNYETHNKTKKHVHRLSGTNLENAGTQKNADYTCKCGKKFLTSSGLWKHNKKCITETNTIISETIIPDEISDKELIIMLIKQNTELAKESSEFKAMMMKVMENGTHNNSHNNNNSHNKTFNLQFFLNETCKDAMNIMDFVNSIQLQLSDLESVGKLGFVEGISNIITTNLKALDVTQRPVHCTDKKREVMYIKDDNKWEKEDEQKVKLRKAIQRVATKNMCLIHKFKEAHPDCSKASSRFSDQYNKIVVEACGGSGDNDSEKEDKIIRNISKIVTIEKE
jgi:hypothetical protein